MNHLVLDGNIVSTKYADALSSRMIKRADIVHLTVDANFGTGQIIDRCNRPRRCCHRSIIRQRTISHLHLRRTTLT